MLSLNGEVNSHSGFGGNVGYHLQLARIRCYVYNQNRNFFDGSIDDIRIYNRALTENEVRALYTLENTPVPSVGIQLWLDGKDLNGDGNLSNELAAGIKLPAWIDKSGNDRDAEQNATVDQPIVSSEGGLLFDGVYDHLTLGK